MYEDIFSENLVDEPADIERVIEGDEQGRFSGNESDKGDNENKSDQEEGGKDGNNKDNDKTAKVRKRMGPRVVLNAERLIGPRGIGVMESFFSDIKLHEKGKEREDLEVVMKRLELWSHRLAPRFHFDDSLKKIEKLGSKKLVQTHLKIARYGRNDDVRVGGGLPDEVPDSPPPPPEPEDPFDQLIATTAPAPAHPLNTDITAEQREQMLRNRLIAEERRAARIKKAQEMREKFLAERNSQVAQSQEAPSSVNIDKANNQPAEIAETPSDPPAVDESQADPTPPEETNNEDTSNNSLPLSAQNENVQVDIQDHPVLTDPTLQNEVSVKKCSDNLDINVDLEKNSLTVASVQNEDVDMEKNIQISTEEQTVISEKLDEKVETTDIEMDTEDQS